MKYGMDEECIIRRGYESLRSGWPTFTTYDRCGKEKEKEWPAIVLLQPDRHVDQVLRVGQASSPLANTTSILAYVHGSTLSGDPTAQNSPSQRPKRLPPSSLPTSPILTTMGQRLV